MGKFGKHDWKIKVYYMMLRIVAVGVVAVVIAQVPWMLRRIALPSSSTANTSDMEDSDKEGDTVNTSATENSGKEEGGMIGIAMPTSTPYEFWIKDAENMKSQLEAKGYTVEIQYAEMYTNQQISQIENWIAQDVDCLVVAAVNSAALVHILEQAKEKEILVISYDKLLVDTDAVSYYVTFDNKEVGTKIGEYIVEAKDLEQAKANGESYTIEFFMGSPKGHSGMFLYDRVPDNTDAWTLYKRVMGVLQPYLDDGTLVCKSGKTSFNDTYISGDEYTVQLECEDILEANYSSEDLDIACTVLDEFAYGVSNALGSKGYKLQNTDSKVWPLITGQGAERMAIRNIIAGYQTMSIYKDTGLLADKCVSMVDACLKGKEPEINDTEQYDNGKIVVPSYLCAPQPVDKGNYKELLVDGGYYLEDDLK